MINLRTFYPYTNEGVEEINSKLNYENFDGVVIPVTVECGRGNSFKILKKENFSRSEFTSSRDDLYNFIEKLDLNDKKVFVSVINLFNALGNKSLEEVRNLETLKRAISDISDFEDFIIINNNFYNNRAIRKEYFDVLKQKYPKFEYAYTPSSRLDSVDGFQNVVTSNVSGSDIVEFINREMSIYLPEFDDRSIYSEPSFADLLGFYHPNSVPGFYSYFQKADITVISNEKADKVLERVLNSR